MEAVTTIQLVAKLQIWHDTNWVLDSWGQKLIQQAIDKLKEQDETIKKIDSKLEEINHYLEKVVNEN